MNCPVEFLRSTGTYVIVDLDDISRVDQIRQGDLGENITPLNKITLKNGEQIEVSWDWEQIRKIILI